MLSADTPRVLASQGWTADHVPRPTPFREVSGSRLASQSDHCPVPPRFTGNGHRRFVYFRILFNYHASLLDTLHLIFFNGIIILSQFSWSIRP